MIVESAATGEELVAAAAEAVAWRGGVVFRTGLQVCEELAAKQTVRVAGRVGVVAFQSGLVVEMPVARLAIDTST